MDRKECRIDRPARMYVRCIGTVGAVDAGCHRLAEQSVGGNGRRRHCPHRSQFPQRPVDAGYLRLPHVQLLSERNVLAFSGSRADLDGVHERTSHGLRQRGPFGFGPRAAALGTHSGPAIAVGSNDLFTSSDGGRFSTSGGEGNQYFGSTYVALSKHFVFSGHRFGVHLAYNVSMNDRFRIDSPVSGGVSFSPRFCRQMNLIAEYDTRCFNLGANALIARHIFVQVLLQKLRYPSCGLCFEFGLWGAGKADRNRRGRSLAGKVSGGSASEGPLKKAKY